MHRYIVTIDLDGKIAQVYPQNREPGTSFEETCKRIGMMVMSEKIETIEVYRDGHPYRRVSVQNTDKEAQP